jgi:hypothetical protein
MSTKPHPPLEGAAAPHAWAAPPQPLLAREGAAVILGSTSRAGSRPVAPTESALFAPRGACVAADGSLWIADTGHHRILGWPVLPREDDAAATVLIGQPTFDSEGRNARGHTGEATFNVPTGICACAGGLAVADGWNHRVLLWRTLPQRHNQPADVVLGQSSFDASDFNRGRDAADADTLFWPFGVAWDGARLWVADTGNRRVLMWNGVPEGSGQPADLVLGQQAFTHREENAGGSANASSMRWPHGIAFVDERLCVSDAGNNRVMVWQRTPSASGQPCDAILGQRTSGAIDHNQGTNWPSAATLNMPYAVAAHADHLVVADTASSRLVGWHRDDLTGCGPAARRLAGQPDWDSKGDNRWQVAARDSLCWPFGLASDGAHAVIADTGNNRVLIWDWASCEGSAAAGS